MDGQKREKERGCVGTEGRGEDKIRRGCPEPRVRSSGYNHFGPRNCRESRTFLLDLVEPSTRNDNVLTCQM
jgi:hypothetical protein